MGTKAVKLLRIANDQIQPRRSQRSGSASVETLLVLAVVLVAAFVFFYVGRDVVGQYFGEGNHYLAVPIF